MLIDFVSNAIGGIIWDIFSFDIHCRGGGEGGENIDLDCMTKVTFN